MSASGSGLTPETLDSDFSQQLTQYTHSVKISDTAKGIRIDVHVYATDKEAVVSEAFDTYIHARDTAISHNIALAPIEIKPTAR
jgi:hypothetical protein